MLKTLRNVINREYIDVLVLINKIIDIELRLMDIKLMLGYFES